VKGRLFFFPSLPSEPSIRPTMSYGSRSSGPPARNATVPRVNTILLNLCLLQILGSTRNRGRRSHAVLFIPSVAMDSRTAAGILSDSRSGAIIHMHCILFLFNARLEASNQVSW
jgi:hypothetical protein